LADLKVLHYRFLGEEYFLQRYQLRQQRMSEQTVKTGMGTSLLVPGGNGRVKIFPASREDLKTVYSNVLTGRPIEEVL
jgi:predicted ATP-grasp superfamily ATP-dependent carboligase